MLIRTIHIYIASLILILSACTQSGPVAEVQEGEASYYHDSLHGNPTASGEPYDKDALTAAHLELAFGTKAKVTYLKTGRSVEVVINDRGPHAKNRILDLSRAAAERIGLVEDGHGTVRIEVYPQ